MDRFIPTIGIYEERNMSPVWNRGLILLVCLVGATVVAFAAPIPCVPPPGFADTPHPSVAPVEQRSRTEEIIINRPLDVVLDAEAKTSLERTLDRNTSLPGVSGTHMLTRGDYRPPGSRRLTCLTDGSTLVEEVLENVRDKNSAHFDTSFGITPAQKPVRLCTE
jgi:hypothetical protein